MSRYERDRGAGFEREVCQYLSERLGRPVRRQLGQARDGGDDIRLGPLRIECKRRRLIAAVAWLEQAEAAAGPGELPVVIARADRSEAFVILRLAAFVPLVARELSHEPESRDDQ